MACVCALRPNLLRKCHHFLYEDSEDENSDSDEDSLGFHVREDSEDSDSDFTGF
jgi:hypothetical protein